MPIARLGTALTLLLASAGCDDSSSGPNGQGELAEALATARVALGAASTRDFSALAPFLAGALASGPRGCTWEFDIGALAYQPDPCNLPGYDSAVAYATPAQDPPPGTSTLPFALPLTSSGFVRVGGTGCMSGFSHHGGMQQGLVACDDANPPGPDDWTALLSTDVVWVVSAHRSEIIAPEPATRYEVRLARYDIDIRLDMRIIDGQERVESRLDADRGGTVLVMDGHADASSPAYTATLDGRALGSVTWTATVGWAAEGPGGAALSSADAQLLLDAREVLGRLGTLAADVSLVLEVAEDG